MSHITNSLMSTVTNLTMSDSDRAVLNAAITASLAQLNTPTPIPHQPVTMEKSMLSPP